MRESDIRWKQRFSNYKKALAQLTKFIEKGELNELVGFGVNLPTTYHCLKALP